MEDVLMGITPEQMSDRVKAEHMARQQQEHAAMVDKAQLAYDMSSGLVMEAVREGYADPPSVHLYQEAGGQTPGECRKCGNPREAGIHLRSDVPSNAPAPPKPTRAGREGDTQPMPVASGSPIMHRLVQDDLAERLRVGVERYGQPLQAFNGRNALQDAYEEVLDLAVYLRQAIYERDHHINGA